MVLVVGLVITGIGIVLIPAPGPGWLVVAWGMTTLALGGALWLARRRPD
jgi:hypothetical protein